jgi:hypothetical protein
MMGVPKDYAGGTGQGFKQGEGCVADMFKEPTPPKPIIPLFDTKMDKNQI